MSDDELERLVALGLLTAERFDENGLPSAAGIIRRLAATITDLAQRGEVHDDQVEGSCRGCGGPVPQASRGRPRQWCSERCRRRYRT